MIPTQQEVQALLRKDFLSFLSKCFSTLHPGRQLSVTWLHHAMAYALARCGLGSDRRLILTMPPRSLKSITISVAWSAWLLGQDARSKIMCVSYSEDLAKRHSRDTRRVMQADWYRAVFPKTVLAKETETELETSVGGFRNATSIGGSVTGLGADWIIIDDPSKAEDALSKPALEKAISFFTGTLYSRLNDRLTGIIIVAMQRIHQEDLAGYLIEQGGWAQLTLPAIAEEDSETPIGSGIVHQRKKGELLQPDRVTRESLEEDRVTMGSANFQAQHQQAPVPAEGNAIKREWLCEYVTAPELSQGRVILSLDTASKTEPSNDYTVLTAWLWFGDNHYLLDVFRERCDYPTLRRQVIERYDRYRPERLLIEDAGSGAALLQDLRHLRGDIVALGIVARDPKSVRVGAASALIENRRLYLPREAPWLPVCLTEVLGFPAAKHDDILDSISQYLNWVRRQQSEGFFQYDMMSPEDPTPLSAALLYGTRLGSPGLGDMR